MNGKSTFGFRSSRILLQELSPSTMSAATTIKIKTGRRIDTLVSHMRKLLVWVYGRTGVWEWTGFYTHTPTHPYSYRPTLLQLLQPRCLLRLNAYRIAVLEGRL